MRQIMLPVFMVDILKRYRTEQLELRLKAGASWQDKDMGKWDDVFGHGDKEENES